jgi:CPA2 family monovalent cation:H+ antiporter-2
MPHNVSLITTIIGPATPGFVADVGAGRQLAEIGVILLMFGVGLHFSLKDLLAVRRHRAARRHHADRGRDRARRGPRAAGAGPGRPPAGVRPRAVGRQHGGAAARAGGRGMLDSMNGRIAVGWLVVEDLVMVLVLVLLPALAGWLGGAEGRGRGALWLTLGITLGKVAASWPDAGGRPAR